jgi:ribosomal-protein-alanine N-acetyltransferase
VIRTTLGTVTQHHVAIPEAATSDWRAGLPVLHAGGVTLRELQLSDAAALHALMTTEEVSRFISPPPSTVEGFERFIAWTHRERAAGTYVCFAIVPRGCESAVGLFQIRQLDPSFETAEWGFALASSFWGSGVFAATAPEIVRFAIETLQVRRLEARSAVENGRGNGALQKIGAVREALLRKSFLKDGRYHDQVLWTICASEWRLIESAAPVRVH